MINVLLTKEFLLLLRRQFAEHLPEDNDIGMLGIVVSFINRVLFGRIKMTKI